MHTCHNLAQWRAYRSGINTESLGFVPTMGNLHDGHLALVKQAKAENDHVAVSIFINPIQFNDSEDFASYPRTLEQDLAALEGLADAVFCPSEELLYPTSHSTIVEVTKLSDILQGEVRAGHFRGVATVVTKLLNIVRADRAYFGLKDYQQVTVLKRLAQDLFIDTEIIACPTIRDSDGLALSSRNQRLSTEQRAAAVIIPKALDHAQTLPRDSVAKIVREFLSQEPLAEVVSVDVRDAKTLEEYTENSASAVLLLAVRFGDVLLIDLALLKHEKDHETH